jgi:hypothetical protein
MAIYDTTSQKNVVKHAHETEKKKQSESSGFLCALPGHEKEKDFHCNCWLIPGS